MVTRPTEPTRKRSAERGLAGGFDTSANAGFKTANAQERLGPDGDNLAAFYSYLIELGINPASPTPRAAEFLKEAGLTEQYGTFVANAAETFSSNTRNDISAMQAKLLFLGLNPKGNDGVRTRRNGSQSNTNMALAKAFDISYEKAAAMPAEMANMLLSAKIAGMTIEQTQARMDALLLQASGSRRTDAGLAVQHGLQARGVDMAKYGGVDGVVGPRTSQGAVTAALKVPARGTKVAALGNSATGKPIRASNVNKAFATDGTKVLMEAANLLGVTDPRHQAYILATSWHETAYRMGPVRETLASSDEKMIASLSRYPWASKYRQKDPATGRVYAGRGYIQLTWADNYQKSGEAISELLNNETTRGKFETFLREGGLDDADIAKIKADPHWLYHNPDYALNPAVSAIVTVQGMRDGSFRKGNRLDQYFREGFEDPVGARDIVNGDVKKNGARIARHYAGFLKQIIGQKNAPIRITNPAAETDNTAKPAPTRPTDPFKAAVLGEAQQTPAPAPKYAQTDNTPQAGGPIGR